MISSTPRIITGIFAFSGAGLHQPVPLDPATTYTVPADHRAQLIYIRAGNSADALVTLVLMRDGMPMRLFPIGARSAQHVPLAVVEDLFPESVLTMHVAAEMGVAGHVVLDMGLLQV